MRQAVLALVQTPVEPEGALWERWQWATARIDRAMQGIRTLAALSKQGKNGKLPEPAAEQPQQQPTADWSIQKAPGGDIWHLRFGAEHAECKDTYALKWLAKILSRPGYAWTVPELRVDPDRKLEANAVGVGQDLLDDDYAKALQRGIEESIEADPDGHSERLHNKLADLEQRLREHRRNKQFTAGVKDEHENIAKQMRSLIKKLHTERMPELAAHLNTDLR